MEKIFQNFIIMKLFYAMIGIPDKYMDCISFDSGEESPYNEKKLYITR
jgi:hypothetical protein